MANFITSVSKQSLLLYSGPDIDWFVQRYRMFMLLGITLILYALLMPQRWSFGGLAGFTLFYLGICCVAFRRWRTEPGVWMLAILFVVSVGSLLLLIEFESWRTVAAQRVANDAGNGAKRAMNWVALKRAIDAALALAVFTMILKLAISVAVKNFAIRKS